MMCQRTNCEMDFLDVLHWVQVVCGAPSAMGDFVRRGVARCNMLKNKDMHGVHQQRAVRNMTSRRSPEHSRRVGKGSTSPRQIGCVHLQNKWADASTKFPKESSTNNGTYTR